MMFQPLIFRGCNRYPLQGRSKKSPGSQRISPWTLGNLLRVAAVRPRRILYRFQGRGVLRGDKQTQYFKYKFDSINPKNFKFKDLNSTVAKMGEPFPNVRDGTFQKFKPPIRQIHSLKLTFSHLKIGHPKSKPIFQPSIFRWELFVSGRVMFISVIPWE